MALSNAYTSLEELKQRLRQEVTDATDDDRLEAAINTASRWIDDYCNRTFYAATATNYYTGEDTELLFVDDLLSITTLKTDDDGDRVYDETWATTDYDLEPYNTTPKTRIRITPQGTKSFPTTRKGVEIVGSFGYNTTGSHPAPIEEACCLMAIRIFKRADAPFGVAGDPATGEMQALPGIDPDVKRLLQPYRRFEAL